MDKRATSLVARHAESMNTTPAHPTPEDIPDDLPEINTPLDLHRCWTMLMGELGFTEPKIWLIPIWPDGMVVPHVVQVAELPAYPSGSDFESLIGVCERLLEYQQEGLSFAMLLSRPGRNVLTDTDRAWAVGIDRVARERGVCVHPTHLANDEAIRVFAPDDLIGVA